MPELPEVQTIVSDLEKKVVGKTIVGFWSDWKRRVRPSFILFKKGVLAKTPLQGKGIRPNISNKKCFRGKKVVASRRIGKHIILDLDNQTSIVAHLKMTGHLLFKSKKSSSRSATFFGERVNGYVRHCFVFSDGSRLEFSDMRKFAWLALVKTGEVEEMKEISLLGLDALAPDLTFKKFNELVAKKPNSKIGVLLLDQNWVAGIGNIYRSEILFEARVHPERLVGDLSLIERRGVYKAMRSILQKAVELRGTSDVDYRDTDGKKGSFQNFLKVYGRAGENCIGCSGKVIRKKIGQRSAFFCPECQK